MSHSKIIIVSLLLISMAGNTAAQEFNVRDQCGEREENMFSLYNRSGGHAAEPGYFEWQVCAAGVEDVELAETCSTGMNSILNLYQRQDSHVSVYNSYPVKVCASFPAQVNSSCSSENRIASLAKLDNSHIGGPNAYDQYLCSGRASVETVTLEMEMDAAETYVDGESASEGVYSSSELDYPYIVSDSPAGIVSYSDAVTVEYQSDGSTDRFRVTQQGGSFILPNTEGGYEEIESREELVTQRSFTDQLSPSFAYLIPDTPVVNVIYDPAINLTGFERELSGNIDLYVRHRSDDITEPVIEIGTN